MDKSALGLKHMSLMSFYSSTHTNPEQEKMEDWYQSSTTVVGNNSVPTRNPETSFGSIGVFESFSRDGFISCSW